MMLHSAKLRTTLALAVVLLLALSGCDLEKVASPSEQTRPPVESDVPTRETDVSGDTIPDIPFETEPETDAKTYPDTTAETEPETDAPTKPETTPETEPPHEHTYADDWTSDATHHWHAATCGHADEVKDRAAHTFGAWVTVKEPTCGEDGERRRTCTTCAYTEAEPIAALTHTYADDWTSDATHHWHAATCGHADEVKDRAAHTFGAWVTVKEPTCGEAGERIRICTTCRYAETEPIAALTHTYADDWTSDAIHHWHAATCGHTDEVKDRAAHTFGAWVTVKEPACGEAGKRRRTCTTCAYTEAEPIAALTHTYADDWTSDATHHWHAATCGHAVTDEKHPHDFGEDGCCTACGYVAVKPAEPIYVLTSDETAYIVSGIRNADSTELVIPSVYNGLPVTAIAANAFKDCTALTRVVLPENLTSMGYWAFAGCNALESITLPLTARADHGTTITLSYIFQSVPASLREVIITRAAEIPSDCFAGAAGLKTVTLPVGLAQLGDFAFAGCTSLQSIVLPEGLTSIGEHAFDGCTGLSSVNIPGHVQTIGAYAFADCTGMTQLTFEDGLNTIGTYAFLGCSGLSTVTIPNSVAIIGDWAFKDCHALRSISLPLYKNSVSSESNSRLFVAFYGCSKVIESVTITGGTVVPENAFDYFDALKKVSLADSVTIIESGAFCGCTKLSEVHLPVGLKTIGDDAFKSTSLVNVTLPEGLETIKGGAFYKCTSLESINIPESVTVIGSSTFAYCNRLRSLVIPAGVTEIGMYCFTGCTALESLTMPCDIKDQWDRKSLLKQLPENLHTLILLNGDKLLDEDLKDHHALVNLTLPATLTEIGASALYGCKGLQTITFMGTVEQWNAIPKGDKWNVGTGSYVVYCTDGEIIK